MTLFRANKRHPADKRVLIIDDPADFALLPKREELRINSLVWDHSDGQEPLQETARDIATLSEKPENGVFERIFPYGEEALYKVRDGQQGFGQQLTKDGLTDRAQTALTGLVGIYNTATGLNDCDLILRVDGFFIDQPHEHDNDNSLSFVFSQAGSVCWAKDGTRYTIDAGQVWVMDRTIKHMSPEPENSWFDLSRVNVIIEEPRKLPENSRSLPLLTRNSAGQYPHKPAP